VSIDNVIKSKLHNASVEDMKARATERVKVKVATTCEKILQVWLTPQDAADVLAGMLSAMAVTYNVPLEQIQSIVGELYDENKRRRAALEATKQSQPQVVTSTQ
jgi:hypothetical protein